MQGQTTDAQPPQPQNWMGPQQQSSGGDLDSDEEEKLEKKLDSKPVPVMNLVPVSSASSSAAAASSSSGGDGGSGTAVSPVCLDDD